DARYVRYTDSLTLVDAETLGYSFSSIWDDNGVSALVACTYDPDAASFVMGVNGTTTAGYDFARFYVFDDDLDTLTHGSSVQISNTYLGAKPFVRNGRIIFLAEYRTSQANSHYAVLSIGADSVVD